MKGLLNRPHFEMTVNYYFLCDKLRVNLNIKGGMTVTTRITAHEAQN